MKTATEMLEEKGDPFFAGDIILLMEQYASQFYTADELVQIANNWRHGGGSIYSYLDKGPLAKPAKSYTSDEVREIIKQIRIDELNGTDKPLPTYLTK